MWKTRKNAGCIPKSNFLFRNSGFGIFWTSHVLHSQTYMRSSQKNACRLFVYLRSVCWKCIICDIIPPRVVLTNKKIDFWPCLLRPLENPFHKSFSLFVSSAFSTTATIFVSLIKIIWCDDNVSILLLTPYHRKFVFAKHFLKSLASPSVAFPSLFRHRFLSLVFFSAFQCSLLS